MSRKYYTLATRTDGRWGPEFGDYSRSVVVQEKADSYADQFKGKDMKIIVSGDTQLEINQAIATLNTLEA